MKVSEKIIQIDENQKNPLRTNTKEVKKNEFGTPYLKNVIKAMQTALSRESDGVALAAPQIGLSLKIFVIAPSAYKKETKWKPLVFVNPKIIKASKKTKEVQEGCLSVRWLYGTTNRSVSVTIQAQDENGITFTYGASDLIAHIFQHECDHLEGILFTDVGFDFQEYTEEEVLGARSDEDARRQQSEDAKSNRMEKANPSVGSMTDGRPSADRQIREANESTPLDKKLSSQKSSLKK